MCEGYALAYKYYMNRLNIPCKVVSGVSKGQPHAWNQIKINGKWYFVDATWDDGSCVLEEKSHPVKHEYFLKSETEFSDHTWNREGYEICNDTTYDNVEWKWVSRKMAAYKGGLYVAGSFPRDGVIKSGIWRYDSETRLRRENWSLRSRMSGRCHSIIKARVVWKLHIMTGCFTTTLPKL